jgi:hypothetical protein
MLRRLPLHHKEHAMSIISGSCTEYSMWDEAHDPQQISRPKWATNDQIAMLWEMGYETKLF